MNSITITINENDMSDATLELLTGIKGIKKGEAFQLPEHIRQLKNNPEEYIGDIVNVSKGMEPSEEFKQNFCLQPIGDDGIEIRRQVYERGL